MRLSKELQETLQAPAEALAAREAGELTITQLRAELVEAKTTVEAVGKERDSKYFYLLVY